MYKCKLLLACALLAFFGRNATTAALNASSEASLNSNVSGIALETPECALRFSEQGCLTSLLNKAGTHDHIAEGGSDHLWILELPEENGGRIVPEDAGSCRCRRDSNVLQFMWSEFGIKTLPLLEVHVAIDYDETFGASRWTLHVEHLDRAIPSIVRFPRITNIAQQENEVLAVPYWMGEKTGQARQMLSGANGAAHRREWTYPGILSLQCITLYANDGPGLYLAANDIQARSKSFAVFGDGHGGLGLEICHFPGADAVVNGRYAPDYQLLLGVYRGDWMTAAAHYRQWALEQPWAKQSRLKEGRVPPWVTDTGCWIWNRGYSKGVLEPAMKLRDALELPVSVFWHWWHGCAYDVGFPEYLPPREGATSFVQALTHAQTAGIRAIVYMNQRLWGMTTDSWTDEQAERHAVKRKDGAVQPEIYNTFTQAPCASMCMGTAFWRNKYAGLAEQAFHTLGVNGIYMDQACSSLVCYDDAHGHAPGGGAYWMEGFRALESDIRKRCPDIVLAGEGCGEAWLPHLDLMLSLQVSMERYAAPGQWEPIPFFHAVYHGYAVLYGNYASLTRPPYDPLWPAEFAPERPLELLDPKYKYQFRLEQARSFVWGQQPCLANFLPEHLQTREEELDYIRRLAQVRNQALPYLLHGTLIRPPRMDIPEMEVDMSRLSIYAGQRESVQEYQRAIPQWLVAAWQGNAGIATALANISDQEHELRIELTRDVHGLPEEGVILKLLPGTRTQVGRFSGGQADIALTLGPAEICMYEFTDTNISQNGR